MHRNNLAASRENRIFAYAKPKKQISCAVTAQLISDLIFATQKEQDFVYIYPKISSFYLFSLTVQVGLCQSSSEPRPVFLRRGSDINDRYNLRFSDPLSFKTTTNALFPFLAAGNS